MHVVVTGSSGRLGRHIVLFLRDRGLKVTRLVRREPVAADEAPWDPDREVLDPAVLAGADAVVHLAGEPIESQRWNAEQKARVRGSRVRGTRLVADALARGDAGPRTLVCASGINYYGDRGDEALTEAAGPGDDFMAETCRQWEAAADPARDAGIRVVHMRTGIVLDPHSGALEKMLPFARLGLLGRLGSGRQYWSWISRDDVLRAYLHAVTTEALAGPVNVTAPTPVTQADFARTLARVLGRPMFPVPAPKLGPWLLYGEMGTSLTFTSMRVLPERLEQSGYAFAHTLLEDGLRVALGR